MQFTTCTDMKPHFRACTEKSGLISGQNCESCHSTGWEIPAQNARRFLRAGIPKTVWAVNSNWLFFSFNIIMFVTESECKRLQKGNAENCKNRRFQKIALWCSEICDSTGVWVCIPQGFLVSERCNYVYFLSAALSILAPQKPT